LLQYLLLSVSETSEPVNKLYYCDLSSLPHGLPGLNGTHELLPFVKLVDEFEAYYGVIANDDIQFTILTNKYAPRYKLSRSTSLIQNLGPTFCPKTTGPSWNLPAPSTGTSSW